MSHLPRRAIGDAEIDELALGPERAVHQHGITGLESLQHSIAEPCEPRDVGQHAAGATVAEGQPDRLNVRAASAQVAWRVATSRERLDLERGPVQGERAFGLEGVPRDAAVVVEHGEHRVPVGKGTADGLGAVDLEGDRRLARKQESSRVVDFRIGQEDPRHRRRTDIVCRFEAQAFELLAQVRRGVGHVHGPSAARIASDDCVRGRADVPVRAASHVLQRQFHCGNPPPAAEPRTRARMLGRRRGLGERAPSAVKRPARGRYQVSRYRW